MTRGLICLLLFGLIGAGGCATAKDEKVKGPKAKVVAVKPKAEAGPAKLDAVQTMPGQQVHLFRHPALRAGKTHYLLFLPRDYFKGDKRWPVMMFLHGMGQRGNDPNQVKLFGPPMLAEKDPDFPFIVVSPQCPDNEFWEPEMVIALLDQIEKTYRTDPERVYLTGLSMGGFGTWRTAVCYPDRFAAIAPVCGGGDPKKVKRIKHLPTWTFHGDKDQIVSIKCSQEMVDALKACGGDVKFTVYPGVDHGSWVPAYNDPELYKWLLAHKRPDPKAATK